jgi:hypothetical protein
LHLLLDLFLLCLLLLFDECSDQLTFLDITCYGSCTGHFGDCCFNGEAPLRMRNLFVLSLRSRRGGCYTNKMSTGPKSWF